MNVVSVFVFILAMIFASGVSASDVIRIHGSNTIGAQLMPALAESWLIQKGYALQPRKAVAENEIMIRGQKGEVGIDFYIEAHGSGTAFKGLAKNTADLGMASRPAKSKEVRALQAYGDITEFGKEVVLGLDGIAVVVHPSNPIEQLSLAQLKTIFSGEVKNWQTLIGIDLPIQVYARDNKSGTFDTFKSLVLGKQSPLVSSAKRYESNNQLSDDVARDVMGIGFTGLPSIRQAKALFIADGDNAAILPSSFSVAVEDYPLSRRLFVYGPKPLTGLKLNFYQYLNSDAAQEVVGKVGFVEQKIDRYDVTFEARHSADYLDTVQGAQRLSLNFRFREGEYKVDNKAIQDLDRLVAFLQRNAYTKVILAGFADGSEAAKWRSYLLSNERADYVAEQLIKKGIVPEVVRGFGATTLVANNETEKGRAKNRRVEVWLK